MPSSMLASAEGPVTAARVPDARLRGASVRVSLAAGLLVGSVVLGLVESALGPSVVVPWMRLGLSNIAVVVALAIADRRTAAAVSIGRVLIVGLATGTLAGPVTLMSLAGAAASLAVMVGLASAVPSLSVVGWSAAGSVAHTAAQFCVASTLLGSASILRLLPPSALVSLAFGVAVGSVSRIVVSRLPHR